MFKKKNLNHKKLFLILLIYTIGNILLYTNNFYINYFKPLFWLIFLTIFYHSKEKITNKKYIYIALSIAIILFIFQFSSGLIFGFIKSPYNHNLISILKNLIKIILPIFGIELIRQNLIKSNKNNNLLIVITTLLIIISEINFKALLASHNIMFFQYLTSIIIPIIARNILFTYLSFNFNYDIPIIFRLFNEVPIYLLPEIPYSDWFINGSFAIIKVSIIYYIFKYFVINKRILKPKRILKMLRDFIIIILSILLILFMIGIFKYKVVAILSNSMRPTFERGDIVIYETKDNISPLDIIVFQRDKQIIIHRVISINDSFYITKGDANNTVDEMKVLKEDIKGVYKFHIKYLGYPSIWLNEILNKGDK